MWSSALPAPGPASGFEAAISLSTDFDEVSGGTSFFPFRNSTIGATVLPVCRLEYHGQRSSASPASGKVVRAGPDDCRTGAWLALALPWPGQAASPADHGPQSGPVPIVAEQQNKHEQYHPEHNRLQFH